MANRRMFAKTVVCADGFYDLSGPAQLLYFHLSMGADDDGFTASVRRTMRDAGATQAELQELADRGYILQFPSGVILMVHWLMNNQLRADRRTATAYKRELAQVEVDPESMVYRWLPFGLPSVDQGSQAQGSPEKEREAEGSPVIIRGGEERGGGENGEGVNQPSDGKELFTLEEYQRLQEIYDPARLDGAIGCYAKIASPYAQHYDAFRAFADVSLPTLRLKGRDEA